MLRLETSLLVKSKIRFYQKKNWARFYIFTHCLCAVSSSCRAGYLISTDWIPDFCISKKTKVMKGRPKQKSCGPKCCRLVFLKHKNFNARKPCWFILMISNVHKLNHRRSASLCKVNNPQGPFFFTSLYGWHAWPCCTSQFVSANNEYYGPCDSAQLAIAVLVHLWCIPHGRFVAGPRSFRGIAWPASRIS